MKPRPSSPSAQLSASLSRFPPETVALAKRCLTRLRRALPGTHQLVYEYTNSLVVAFGASERGYEAVLSLAVQPREVRLYLRKSTPDPKRLLEGAGSKVRSVAIGSASELDRGDVGALLQAAIADGEVGVPKTRSNRIVIKSAPKKPRPTKARNA